MLLDNVHQLPVVPQLRVVPDEAPARPGARVRRPDPHTYSFFEVARRTGCAAEGGEDARPRSEKYIRDYLTLMIAEEGLPAPLPLLVKGRLSKDVHSRSRWLAMAFDAWISRTARAAVAQEIEERLAGEAADRLDQSADDLFPGDA